MPYCTRFRACGGAAIIFRPETPQALRLSALRSICSKARAQFDSPERIVNIRVAEYDGQIYLDLADQHWRAVEIRPEGWRVIRSPPVRRGEFMCTTVDSGPPPLHLGACPEGGSHTNRSAAGHLFAIIAQHK